MDRRVAKELVHIDGWSTLNVDLAQWREALAALIEEAKRQLSVK